jgi:hypothetical protein
MRCAHDGRQRTTSFPFAWFASIAAVDRPSHPAHQRQDRLLDGEPIIRVGRDDPGALDPADLRCLDPFAAPHVKLGMVHPECLHADHDIP